MKAYKTCVNPDCGAAFHISKVGNVCRACGTAYPVKTTKVQSQGQGGDKPPTERELALTKGHQGFRQCSACRKFSSVRRLKCAHCLTPFGAKPAKTEAPEAEPIEAEDGVAVDYFAEQPAGLPAEIINDIEGYDIPEEIREKYVVPFGTTVLNMAETKPAFMMEVEHPGKLPSDNAIKRWAHELRKYMLEIRAIWVTNGCLYGFMLQQFKGTFDRKSEEMEYARLLLSELPDVHRKRSAIAV